MQQSHWDTKYQWQIKLVSKSDLMETNESNVTECENKLINRFFSKLSSVRLQKIEKMKHGWKMEKKKLIWP